jgi:hypothetical protein
MNLMQYSTNPLGEVRKEPIDKTTFLVTAFSTISMDFDAHQVRDIIGRVAFLELGCAQKELDEDFRISESTFLVSGDKNWHDLTPLFLSLDYFVRIYIGIVPQERKECFADL